MIGIGGLARAGKDTLAKCLSKMIEDELNVDVKIFVVERIGLVNTPATDCKIKLVQTLKFLVVL